MRNRDTAMHAPSKTRRITETLAAIGVGVFITVMLYAAVDSRSDQLRAQIVADPPAVVGNNGGRTIQSPRGRMIAPPAPTNPRGNAAAADLSQAFREVADRLRPSVVSISTRSIQTIRSRTLPPGFEQFFGMPAAPRQRESSGVGSGVIVRSDGYIITNNHVVDGVDELFIRLADGRNVEGRVVGNDPDTDLAIVKIDAENLIAATFGDSEAIRVGDWVLAIGSPFGLEQTVTAGIISGKNRVQSIIEDGRGFEDFLQTDAAINPGNSGGALVNLRGELVGINTAILSKSGASAGIGFAIPESMVRPVLTSIIETGSVRRGFLGASTVAVTPEIALRFELKVTRGAFIDEVLSGSPASAAGLSPGDVIVAIENKPCTSGTQLKNFVARQLPGARFNVTVNRNGQSFKATIVLDERTAELMSKFGAGEVEGLELFPATPKLAAKYGYAEDQRGLIVTGTQADSPLAGLGLVEGDIIEAVNGQTLEDAEDLREALTRKAPNQSLRLNIRQGRRRMVMLVR